MEHSTDLIPTKPTSLFGRYSLRVDPLCQSDYWTRQQLSRATWADYSFSSPLCLLHLRTTITNQEPTYAASISLMESPIEAAAAAAAAVALIRRRRRPLRQPSGLFASIRVGQGLLSLRLFFFPRAVISWSSFNFTDVNEDDYGGWLLSSFGSFLSVTIRPINRVNQRLYDDLHCDKSTIRPVDLSSPSCSPAHPSAFVGVSFRPRRGHKIVIVIERNRKWNKKREKIRRGRRGGGG